LAKDPIGNQVSLQGDGEVLLTGDFIGTKKIGGDQKEKLRSLKWKKKTMPKKTTAQTTLGTPS